MEAYVKSFAAWRTIKKAAVLSSSLTLDSLDKDTSTVTVAGTAIGRSNTGDWLIVDGSVYHIALIKPENDRAILTLESPLDAFSRLLELSQQSAGATIGGFVAGVLRSNWRDCDDPDYAMPYLDVSDSGTSAFVAPELDDGGCFDLPSYLRLMRKSYRVKVTFSDEGSRLHCKIFTYPEAAHNVSFSDGRSQLGPVDYSSSGMAKVTAIQDVDTGEKTEDGEKITVRERSIWYLAEDGSITETVPDHRASGKWGTVTVRPNQTPLEAVTAAFAKNKANHKLEFYSTLNLNVQDDCTFFVYGELLRSYISCKRKSSTDRRYYYKSGELATTASEKLKEVFK